MEGAGEGKKMSRREAKKQRIAQHQQRAAAAAQQHQQANEAANSFTATCNILPSAFPLQANGKVREPELLKRWQDEGLYQQCQVKNLGNTEFILHDGPPCTLSTRPHTRPATHARTHPTAHARIGDTCMVCGVQMPMGRFTWDTR